MSAETAALEVVDRLNAHNLTLGECINVLLSVVASIAVTNLSEAEQEQLAQTINQRFRLSLEHYRKP